MRNIIPLFLLFQFLFLPCFGQVVINEVMYAPTTKLGGSSNEWIELYNPTNESINLSGWNISDSSKNYTLTNLINISAYGYFILARKPEKFSQYWNVSCPIANFTRPLNNDYEIITLYNSSGDLVDSVTYDDSWGLMETDILSKELIQARIFLIIQQTGLLFLRAPENGIFIKIQLWNF